MGRVISVLVCQQRSYWRGFARSGNLTAGNQGVLLIVAGLAFYKYVRALSIAESEVHRGNTAMLERLLLMLFLAWLFPLFSSSRLSVKIRSLRQWPFVLAELFAIRAGSLLITPFAWLVVAASVAIALPLGQASHPFAGIVAAILFVMSSWLVGLTLAQLVSIAVWRKVLSAAILGLTAIGFYMVRGSLVNFRALSFLPARFVSQAANGEGIANSLVALTALVVVVIGCALWSFRASLNQVDTPNLRSRYNLTLLPGKTGPLSVKDLRYSRKLLDTYLGLFGSGLGCFYFVIAETASPEVFWIFIIFVFFPNASLAFNSFGLDSQSGLDRYALLPVPGREIVYSKNVAYMIALIIQLIPLFAFALWRLDFRFVLFGMLQALLLGLAYLAWGNFVAVTHRFKMEFYRFSSGGAPIDALAGVIFSTLPGAVAIQLFDEQLWWVSLVMLVGYGVLYWFSLAWSGRRVDRGLLMKNATR